MKSTKAKAPARTVATGRNQQGKRRDLSAFSADRSTTNGERGATVRFYAAGTNEVLFDLDLDAETYARIKRLAGDSDRAVIAFIEAAVWWKLAHLEKEPVPAGGKGGVR